MEFPIIDVADIDKPESQLRIAREITEATQTWGFLLLKNHSIPNQCIDELFSLSRRFFVDTEEEQKTPWPVNGQYVGYNRALTDRMGNDKASMWLSGRPGCLAQNLDAIPPFWHTHVEKVETFKHTCHFLVIKLLLCFALAMGLEDRDFFAKAHAENAGDGNQFRMICYPARANSPQEVTTRMSAHSDSGSVTLLFQSCAGLEVESPTGAWVPAPYLPSHILVNIGDALAFWSGRHLKATKHRITFKGVPFDKERLSMAYFGAASPDTVLEPIKMADAHSIESYEANDMILKPGITVGEYGKRIMESIYGVAVARETKPESVAEVDIMV